MSEVKREDIIEGWDQWEREEPMAPEQIEGMLRQLSGRIARGVRITSDRLDEYKAAERAYDRAFARAYMAYDGAAHAKRYYAELQVEAERDAMDVAEVSWRYADSQARALRDILSSFQSISSSVRTMFSVAGR